MIRSVKKLITDQVEHLRLPTQAKLIAQTDRRGLPSQAIDAEAAIHLAYNWLCQAQDATADGGVSRDYSLVSGWATSYPETTGYIIPTFLELSGRNNLPEAGIRARKMLDWLVSIQFADGGFQGGKADASPCVPVTFNTGQILIGLAAGCQTFGEEYRTPMFKAAIWLRDSLDEDGCWRRYPTPFAAPGEKAYETHVSWGLYEAARIENDKGFQEAADRNIYWALTKQNPNGWFDDCCLENPAAPLTHTLGYVLRGLLEAYEFSGNADFLNAAKLTADGLLTAIDDHGYLAGRLNADWSPAVPWVCLTGSVQIAYCWLRLFEITGNQIYLDAGRRANLYVRKTLMTDGDPSITGGVRGSFPVDGDYGRFEFLNWAAKFLIDSHIKELSLDPHLSISAAQK